MMAECEATFRYRSNHKCRRPGFNPWVRKIPWKREWQPLQYPCPENSMDRGAMRSQRVGHD